MTRDTKHEVSWEEVHSAVEHVVTQIRHAKIEFNSITTVARGGLVVAALLAYRLNIHKIHIISSNADYYPEIPEFGKTLFVDEIFDSGKTVKKIIEHYGVPLRSAALHTYEDAEIKPDFYSELTTQWQIYPWEC